MKHQDVMVEKDIPLRFFTEELKRLLPTMKTDKLIEYVEDMEKRYHEFLYSEGVPDPYNDDTYDPFGNDIRNKKINANVKKHIRTSMRNNSRDTVQEVCKHITSKYKHDESTTEMAIHEMIEDREISVLRIELIPKEVLK